MVIKVNGSIYLRALPGALPFPKTYSCSRVFHRVAGPLAPARHARCHFFNGIHRSNLLGEGVGIFCLDRATWQRCGLRLFSSDILNWFFFRLSQLLGKFPPDPLVLFFETLSRLGY